MKSIELIKKERERQINKEGWTASHDKDHSAGSLAAAGASYALDVAARLSISSIPQWNRKIIYHKCSDKTWPFEEQWFKPTPEDPVRQLVKAGALIAAEIDRILNETP